jgi:hypothetical protein
MVSAKSYRIFGLVLAVLALGMGIPAAHASIIYVNSDAGPDEYNVENGGPQNPDVQITVTPAWVPNGMGYEWVSYAQTGCNTFVALTGICTPGVANPPASTGNITLSDGPPSTPTAIFFNNFVLPAGDTFSGTLSVWADDTARVYLDGILLTDANPIPGGNCAISPVGCLASTVGVFNIGADLLPGENTLELDAYQFLGGSPFGVMYTASITATPADSPTPEPASYVLMGLGLVAIGILIPRARRA